MGWGDCGTDSKGRPIGYSHSAVCDHPGCKEKIDRGLGYACGGMHGTETLPATSLSSCEGYFCRKHRSNFVAADGEEVAVCSGCAAELLASGEWHLDHEDELIWPNSVLSHD